MQAGGSCGGSLQSLGSTPACGGGSSGEGAIEGSGWSQAHLARPSVPVAGGRAHGLLSGICLRRPGGLRHCSGGSNGVRSSVDWVGGGGLLDTVRCAAAGISEPT